MAGEVGTPEFLYGFPKTQAAVAYARRLHAGQLRQADGAPFIVHPLEVVSLLYDAGAPDEVIAAGALHDTLEKTEATAADLTRRFGPHVASVVTALTEDESIATYAARKAALRRQVVGAGQDSLLVFAADKLSKARELRLPGVTLRRRRINHYRHCLTLLERELPGSPLVRALRDELASLSARRQPEPALI
ncbi:MAG TPA: HD domain-containing protein [Solirubrobacteraceae bacterium]|jgi:(p)ppGpp synthase/HD superfamily hydrolase|nr:HD domain-containing protein [Solirubrobacteraceae bacterium]